MTDDGLRTETYSAAALPTLGRYPAFTRYGVVFLPSIPLKKSA